MKKKIIYSYLSALEDLNIALVGNASNEIICLYFGGVDYLERLLATINVSVHIDCFKNVALNDCHIKFAKYVCEIEIDGIHYEFSDFKFEEVIK